MNPTRAVFILLAILLLSVLPCISKADGPGDSTPSQPQPETSRAGFESLLELMQIGPKQLAQLPDGKPLSDAQRAVVLRVLLRIDDLPLEDMQRWARPYKGGPIVGADPPSARGHFYRPSGNVKSVETVMLSPDNARRLTFKQYYRVRMLLDGNNRPGDNRPGDNRSVVILTRTVPQAWLKQLKQNTLDAPATAVGMFLRLADNGSDNSGQSEPIFAAQRIAWHPPGPLGELGMDVGLLDELRDRKKIGARERECFYQMLAAVGRAEPGELMRLARDELKRQDKKTFSVVPLFNEPAKQRGRLVMFSGTARRVVKVHVKAADIVRRFGIRYYYEIYLYTPDSQDNPLVFCVRYLPEGMPTGSDPQYSQQIKVAGFFLKTWGFRPESAGMTDGDSKTRQLAPLLIAREPIWLEPSESGELNPLFGAVAGGLFILVLLAIWLAVWHSAKKDRQFNYARRKRLDS